MREMSFLIDPHLSDIKVTRGPHAFLVSLLMPRFAPIRESRALLKFFSIDFPAFSELTLTSLRTVSMESATTPFILPQALFVSLSEPFQTLDILSPILPNKLPALSFRLDHVSPKDFVIPSHALPAFFFISVQTLPIALTSPENSLGIAVTSPFKVFAIPFFKPSMRYPPISAKTVLGEWIPNSSFMPFMIGSAITR